MSGPTIERQISDYIAVLEKANDVKVLYAVESGSRAWGFPSPDSDYDVRFIYIHSKNWYLSIQKRREVIEAMTDPDLDFAGWDIRKTLGLLQKSNPSLLEWMNSPIVYRQDEEFVRQFRELGKQCLSLNACHYHYLSMAQANWATYFKEDLVSLKKYLYVLRPLYACRWIEHYQTMPPVEFNALVQQAGAAGSVGEELSSLLAAKAQTAELGVAPRRPALDKFIEEEIARFKAMLVRSRPPISSEILDDFFRSSLEQFAPADSEAASQTGGRESWG